MQKKENNKRLLLVKRFFFCVTLFVLSAAGFAQNKKEMKEKAKAEAKAEKMISEQAAKMEAEGWKVMKSSASLLDILKEKRAKKMEMVANANDEFENRYLVDEEEVSGAVLDKALKECQTLARKNIVTELKKTVETATLVKTKSDTDSDGKIIESSRTKTFTNLHSSAMTNKIKELARLYCKTEDGYKVKVVMFVDLKELEM